MTLEIRQQCNSCGNIRVIPCGREIRRFVNIQNAAEQDGWKQVADDKHLCPHCIKQILDDMVVNFPKSGKPIIVNYPKET